MRVSFTYGINSLTDVDGNEIVFDPFEAVIDNRLVSHLRILLAGTPRAFRKFSNRIKIINYFITAQWMAKKGELKSSIIHFEHKFKNPPEIIVDEREVRIVNDGHLFDIYDADSVMDGIPKTYQGLIQFTA